MDFKNARIFTQDFRFFTGCFSVREGRFANVLGPEQPGAVDLEGARVIPGLVDIHTHGNSGADASDGDEEGLRRMAAYEGRCGVTSFLPTTMTLPYDVLGKAFDVIRTVADHPDRGAARVLGIDMEGPFFSEKRKGAQNAAYLKAPDVDAFRRLNDGCGGLVRIVAVAPELPGAAAFVSEASKDCVVSIAHTAGGYDEARAAIDAGATHLTHLYNAMNPLHHRDPGPIAAASESESVMAELICDGIHSHPAAVRAAFKLFPGRICLISDSMRACGLPEGEYDLGGQTVFLQGRKAALADGTIAGSATNLYDCMVTAVSFGIPVEEAIRAAAWNPARSIGMEDRVGSIRNGKWADFVICDDRLAPKAVYVGGEAV